MLYRLAEGVRTESLSETWASFSALSGETMLVNTEAAAILEWLSGGPATELQVARALANDAQTDLARVEVAIRHIWDQLLSAGLIEASAVPEHNVG